MPDVKSAPPNEDRPASPFDVEACYRLFLGRCGESPEAIASHLSDAPSVWTLIDRFRMAPEARRQLIYEASQKIHEDQDARGQEPVLDEAQAQAFAAHIEKVWSRYGREEAFFSVLTDPRYLSRNLHDAELNEFYASGEAEVRRFLAICARNEVQPRADWSVLELGCGVARMGEAFAQRFSVYAGVDISASHLAIARERLRARRVINASLRLLGDFLNDGDGYDVFYSVIVLQHNPPPIMDRLLDVGLRRLNPGGYAFFQVPCFLYDYAFRAETYLAERGQGQTMEMHALPQRHVFALLAKHGLQPIEAAPDGLIGPIGLSYSFLARKAC
uniref:Methyltransferase type 12 n=1 Tax=Caulobacter sp. (strain K31) TaxID=366602 RepID=B0T6Z3_CAUSK